MNPVPFTWMLIAIAISFVAGGSASWHVASWKHDADDKHHIELALEAQKRAEDRAEEISTKFSDKLDHLKVVNTTITQKVQRELETRVYSDCKLPDSGVVLFNSGVDAANDALGFTRTMPADPPPRVEGRDTSSDDGRAVSARSRFADALRDLRSQAAGSPGKRQAGGKIQVRKP